MHVTSLGFVRLYYKGSLADLEGLRVVWWFLRAWGLRGLGVGVYQTWQNQRKLKSF